MSKPCFACRARKVVSTQIPVASPSPIFASSDVTARAHVRPCSRARKTVQCVYLDVEVGAGAAVKQDLLRKGAACAPCRSKKKKCDGKLPFCNTCKVAGKEDECQYNDGVHRSVKAELLERIEELEERLRMYENRDASGSSGSSTTSTQPSSVGALVPVGIPDVPASTYIFWLQLPQDYDFSSIRTRFFSHCPQIGICLTDERRDALYAGNVSVIHPALLYARNCGGLQNALATLDDISLTLDPTTALEATQILSLYFFTKSDIFKGREYLLKASHIALQHNVRIVSIAQSISREDNATWCRQLTVPADEQLSILCQLIGMDRSQGLMFGTPMIFPDEYELEIKVLPAFLLVVVTRLFLCCIASIKDVVSPNDILPPCGLTWRVPLSGVDRSNKRYIRFTDLVARIREHNVEVDRRREATAMLNDIHNDRALKVSQMTALSALADLHFAMAPTILDSRKLAVEVVTQIVHMTFYFRRGGLHSFRSYTHVLLDFLYERHPPRGRIYADPHPRNCCRTDVERTQRYVRHGPEENTIR
ncbi:hypothetical protein BDZ89DRAFT_1139154 [Hymenopellis radicata]|nr:hypothetical protein BDZ89DRAFT_1139154 [Hymenopellis radicata]